jgi:hypothetical protein
MRRDTRYAFWYIGRIGHRLACADVVSGKVNGVVRERTSIPASLTLKRHKPVAKST